MIDSQPQRVLEGQAMDATKTAWHRRWLPPLLLLAALVTLTAGVVMGLTADTRDLRFVGWLLAVGAACTTGSASWLLWWVRSGRDGPPPRH
jgi:hypothetical protein